MGKPWGFTRACSGSFNFGGTIWAISKDSENVDLAYDFLSRVLLSDAGARYAKYKENGTYIAYKPAYEIDGYRNLVVECFDNQDIGEIFFETIIDEVDAIQRGENSEAIENIFMDIVLWMMDDPDLKVDDCYAMFIERCNLLLE